MRISHNRGRNKNTGKHRLNYLLMEQRRLLAERKRLLLLQQKLKDGRAFVDNDGTIIELKKKG